MTTRKTACAETVTWNIEPQGNDGDADPVHCQLTRSVNAAESVDPPGPNCTVTVLEFSVQFWGVNIHEMLPAIWNVRSTNDIALGGRVIVTKSCGLGMTRLSQVV